MGAIVALIVLAWIVEHIVQILLVAIAIGLIIAVIAGLAHWVRAAHEQSSQRRACSVCTSWSGSVVLTDLNPQQVPLLCPRHKSVLQRLAGLERELLQ